MRKNIIKEIVVVAGIISALGFAASVNASSISDHSSKSDRVAGLENMDTTSHEKIEIKSTSDGNKHGKHINKNNKVAKK